LAASDPGVDQARFPVFFARNVERDLVRLENRRDVRRFGPRASQVGRSLSLAACAHVDFGHAIGIAGQVHFFAGQFCHAGEARAGLRELWFGRAARGWREFSSPESLGMEVRPAEIRWASFISRGRRRGYG
jgi:hypothetical protein